MKAKLIIVASILAVIVLAVCSWFYVRDTNLYVYSAMNAAQEAERANDNDAATRSANEKLESLQHRLLTPSQNRSVAAIAAYLDAVRAYRELQTPFLYRITQVPEPYDAEEATMVCRWAMYGHVLGDWNSKYLVISNGKTGEIMHQYQAKDGDCLPAIQRLREADTKAYHKYLDSLAGK